jgi:uncharacterized protein (UPF0333 family)
MGKRGVFCMCNRAICAKKSQISLEFAIIIGFVTMLLIPLISTFYMKISDTNNLVITRQAYNLARDITDSAENVYYLGAPSKTLLKVYMPANIRKVEIGNNSVVFFVKIGNSTSELESTSKVPVYGALKSGEGIRYITIEAEGNSVHITG